MESFPSPRLKTAGLDGWKEEVRDPPVEGRLWGSGLGGAGPSRPRRRRHAQHCGWGAHGCGRRHGDRRLRPFRWPPGSPLGPTSPPVRPASPSGRGGAWGGGVHVGLFSPRSFLSSPRKRRRDPTAFEAHFVSQPSRRQPPPHVVVLASWSPGHSSASASSPPAPHRRLQKRTETPSPTYLVGH